MSPFKLVIHRLHLGSELNILLDLTLDGINDELIRRLLLKLKSENLLEHFPKIFRNNSEYFLSIFNFETFPEEIFELITSILELFVEIAPW